MSIVGTVLRGVEPMVVARKYAAERFPLVGTPGFQTLVYDRGSWWVWYGDRWRLVEGGELRKDLALWLEASSLETKDGGSKAFPVKRGFLDDTMNLLEAVCWRGGGKETPSWITLPGESAAWDSRWCVGFEDLVVHVTADGLLEYRERDPRWLDYVVLPGTAKGGLEAPVWEECLRVWGEGDPVWAELAERWLGMCLVGYREFGRWMLLFGRIRAGKGVYTRVLQRLVGDRGFVDKGMVELSRRFGTKGILSARVLSVSEVTKLGGQDGETLAALVKRAIGRDLVEVDEKYKEPVSGRVGAAIMMSSNEVPTLPDGNQGLSGKMLLLPFRVSHAKREDLTLEDRLAGELPAIARRGLAALARWRGEKHPADRWPEPEAALGERRKIQLTMNPIRGFLESRFVEKPDGFTLDEVVWAQWVDFARTEEVTTRMGQAELRRRLELEGGWHIRWCQSGTGSTRGRRGFRGMSLRRIPLES